MDISGRELETSHGTISLPAFFPDATRGVVRTVGSGSLCACGVQGVVVNSFLLRRDPGARAIARLGGVHAFMSWPRPVLSDSGGFQIFSLLRQSPAAGSVTAKGFLYRPGEGQAKMLLTAQNSLQAQLRLGSDILVCLDHCTHPDASAAEQRTSVEHTVAWARASKQAFAQRWSDDRLRPLLFAVIQGGTDFALRQECAQRLLEIGFDGYGYGGWPVRDDGALVEAVAMVAELTPRSLPLWGLGIGAPRNLAQAFSLGYDLFDCVLPTRDGRKGRLFVGDPRDCCYLYILERWHRLSPEPIDERCPCPCCRSYSRAYLHHLFRLGEPLGAQLATLHNLAFYGRLLEALRSDPAARTRA
jgi:queuine tRNA-ribosyltransferase